MKRFNLNFRKSYSDRRAERTMKAGLFYRLQPIKSWHAKIDYNFRSKYPHLHAKIPHWLKPKS